MTWLLIILIGLFVTFVVNHILITVMVTLASMAGNKLEGNDVSWKDNFFSFKKEVGDEHRILYYLLCIPIFVPLAVFCMIILMACVCLSEYLKLKKEEGELLWIYPSQWLIRFSNILENIFAKIFLRKESEKDEAKIE